MAAGAKAEFGTVEVYEVLADVLNNDPKWAELGKDIDYSMIYDYGAPVSKAFFVHFRGGKVESVHELASADAEPADFVLSGNPDVWRGVLDRTINPTVALTRGQLKVKGKMTTLLKNMNTLSYINEALTKIELV